LSFDDDVRDAPFYIRPAATIEITCTDGTHVQTIELPELKLTRDQVSPAWLAAHDAEQAEKDPK